jgi:hypothetical protein
MSESDFVLALDLGTSRIAAATARLAPSGESEAGSVVLGHRSGSIATVAYMTDDGDVLFGDAAEQRGFAHPDRLLRSFTRRIGDDVPLIAGGFSVMPESLCARLVVWVRDLVAHREDAPPALVALAHPAAWTGHRVAVLRAALSDAGIEEVEFLPSATAGALHHESARALASGAIAVVYDLGGTSFESTVLRKADDGSFTVLGEPEIVPDHGGSLFDDAVMRYAVTASGVAVDAARGDPDAHVPLARLRRSCIAAKHALSFDAEATIPVPFPDAGASVRITRSELETMIEPALEPTLDALERSIRSAGRSAEQVDLILLLGGSTHIPLVAQQLSDRFDRPLAAASDAAAAMGAALAGLRRLPELGQAAVAAPAASGERSTSRAGRRGVLAALRPAFGGLSARAATTTAVVAAGVIVAAGVAASAVAAVSAQSASENALSAVDSRHALESIPVARAALLVLTASASQSAVAPSTAPQPPPGAVPELDEEKTDTRRAARQPLTAPVSPVASTAPAPPSTAPQAPAVVVPTPSAPPTSDPAPSDPPPADPAPSSPPSDPPPSDPPTTEPAPSEPPPAEPSPPAEEPTPAPPEATAGPSVTAS